MTPTAGFAATHDDQTGDDDEIIYRSAPRWAWAAIDDLIAMEAHNANLNDNMRERIDIAAKAVAFGEALRSDFKKYAKQTLKNAKALETELVKSGARMLFGGTENHMVLVDTVASYGLSGKEAETRLENIGITVNKNVIPDDTRGPLDPSGIRIGVPAITTRGMKEKETRLIARAIGRMLQVSADDEGYKRLVTVLRKEIRQLCRQFPLYR